MSRFIRLPIIACVLVLASSGALAQFSLTTIYAQNNGLSGAGSTVYFDLTVNAAVRISAFDINTSAGVGAQIGLNVYTMPGSSVGNELNPAPWTQVATDNGTGVGAGVDLPSHVPLTSPLLLTPGSYGMALENPFSGGHKYTNGNGANQVYSDSFLTIACGSSSSQAFGGSFNTPRVFNGTIYYTPGQGLFTNFAATPTAGASPLAVQFTDTTYTSDPGGVTSWAWDFESDGIIDSTIQNPPHTYNTCGYFDVTLTTTDAAHSPSTETKHAFITVDPQLLVTADFSATPRVVTAPGVVNFSDTSAGSPTAWAWDLDGDNVIDSTLQNPAYTYNVAGWYDVTLTASNTCGGHTITKPQFVNVVGATSNTQSPELLEFQFNETRGDQVANTASSTIAPGAATIDVAAWQGDPGRRGFMGNEPGFGCMGATAGRIDTGWTIDITGSNTVMFWQRVQSVPTSSYAFGGTVGSSRCYYAGTYWSLRNWGNLPGFIDSSTDPGSLAGWNHWAVVVDDAAGTGQWYLNGVADGAPLSFTPGTFVYTGAGNFIIGTYGSSTRYSTYAETDDFRLYSRALSATEIQAALLHENATTSRYAGGCAGIIGVPQIGANGAPTVGNAGFALTLDNAELGRGGLLVLGAQAHTWLSVVPLPYSLDFLFGAGSGCGLQTGLDVLVPINTGGGSLSLPFPIPAGYAGSHGYAQFLILGTQGAVTAGLDINIERP